MRYRLISAHPEYSEAKWAVFLHVSRSGYHEWKHSRTQRKAREEQYAERVRQVFEEGMSSYGAKRICGKLREQGHTASFHKVQASMRAQGLVCVHWRRRQRSLTDSISSRGSEYVNLVRGFKISAPFEVLSSDISYVRTQEGFVYLRQIRDVASGLILAHAVSDRMKKELVLDALRKAFTRWLIPKGCIFHSDRGSQYTSMEVMKFLAVRKIKRSFSRVGMPGDNAWSESFFANLKKEVVHRVRFAAKEDVRQAIFSYIEAFYNTKRVQERLGYLSPMQWLEHWDLKLVAGVA